jgi:hypothetical protein
VFWQANYSSLFIVTLYKVSSSRLKEIKALRTGLQTWGVKFEVILLLNFHPVFITVILCRVGSLSAGSQNRMTINIA